MDSRISVYWQLLLPIGTTVMNRKKRKFLNRLLFAFIIMIVLLSRSSLYMEGGAAGSLSKTKVIISCSLAIACLVIINFVIKKDKEE